MEFLIEQVPDAIEGKMFGVLYIKSTNGKACAIFWNNSMLFKLDDKEQVEALKLDGVKTGAHLNAQDKPVKGGELLFPYSDIELRLNYKTDQLIIQCHLNERDAEQ